jgi:hypothetical protein
MNKPLSCGAQDMLEAAIMQKRRINITCANDSAHVIQFNKVLPVDIFTKDGVEQLAFFDSDNSGGILKLTIDTADIIAFEAKDFKDPRIIYNRSNDSSCELT